MYGQHFLQLSTEVSEPFIIPNVSPVSSPRLNAKSATINGRLPNMGGNNLSPLVVIEEEHDEELDSTLLSTRQLSIIDLN
ncbi:hypothetical protein SBY92_004042 [Candida maltosa Xu316]|uniref:Uncharacterized protein n=1 Tax=Candida maltosa (strain Xu316) TaxID=1245528 RepID=M3K0F2_CANMX|nr:hypothetical protein G210_0617 [Candida maltosa Xu316]